MSQALNQPATHGPLSAEEVLRFHTEGYLMVENVFTPADIDAVCREFEENMDGKVQRLAADGAIANPYRDEPFDRRAACVYADDHANGEAMVSDLCGRESGRYTSRAMYGLLTNPRLLTVAESLVGPEIIASSVYRIRAKIPGIDGKGRGVVGWHQDSAFFSPACDKSLIVTCWVALVDTNEENGCMHIIPGVHRQGIIRHGGRDAITSNYSVTIQDPDLPPVKPVIAAVRRGGVVLMHNMTPHCAPRNRTGRIRWTVDLRLQGAEVPTNAHLMPDPGARSLPREFERACFPPEADCVVQSPDQPERIVTYEQFVARRAAFQAATDRQHIKYLDRWRVV